MTIGRTWVAGTVLGIVSLVTAQDPSCECVAYFYCPSNQQKYNTSCAEIFEVCCHLGPNPATTPSPATVTPEPNPKSDLGSQLCGVRKQAKLPTGFDVGWKIFDPLGDTNTSFAEFPWMVAIMKMAPEGQTFLCGGSIVQPNLILTAAHSISGIAASSLKVKAGIWNTTDIVETAKHQDRNVLEVVQHPGFDKARVANDFALLVLDQPLYITENVGPACLPSSRTPYNRSSCVATGWGAENFGDKKVSSVLRKVDLPLVDFNACQQRLQQVPKLSQFTLHDSFLCAGGAHADTCTGDGGGPLMCASTANKNIYVQVGITSWGIGCGQNIPGVYSSVETAVAWIEAQADRFPVPATP